jgi:hypothetical protein
LWFLQNNMKPSLPLCVESHIEATYWMKMLGELRPTLSPTAQPDLDALCDKFAR